MVIWVYGLLQFIKSYMLSRIAPGHRSVALITCCKQFGIRITDLISIEDLIRIRTNQIQSSIPLSFDCNREILDCS